VITGKVIQTLTTMVEKMVFTAIKIAIILGMVLRHMQMVMMQAETKQIAKSKKNG